jgi:hypothetical protein
MQQVVQGKKGVLFDQWILQESSTDLTALI